MLVGFFRGTSVGLQVRENAPLWRLLGNENPAAQGEDFRQAGHDDLPRGGDAALACGGDVWVVRDSSMY